MTPLWSARINWTWITYRLRNIRRCSHEWTTGDRVGHRACRRCGTWRWFPLVKIARTPRQHGMDRGDSPEDLLEYGRWLASWREDLIAQGVDPAELAVPLAPPEEPNTDRGDK